MAPNDGGPVKQRDMALLASKGTHCKEWMDGKVVYVVKKRCH